MTGPTVILAASIALISALRVGASINDDRAPALAILCLLLSIGIIVSEHMA